MEDKNEELYNYAKEGHEYYLKAESFELKRNYQDAKVNYIKSIEIYENIIKIDPKNEDAFSSLVFHYFHLGTILSHLKEYKEAIESFKKSIENSKKLLEVNFDYWSTLGFRYLGNAFWGLGKIYFVFNEYESAKNIFKEALEYFKKINDEIQVPLSFLMLGYVYFNLKEFKNAKDSFKEALERYKIFIENMKTNIDKKNIENVWEYWGFDPSYCRNNNVDSKELDEYKKRFYFSFQKFNSLNFGDIYFDLACTHFNLKEYEEAEEIFKKVIEKYNDAIKSNPKNKEALVNLGIAYLNLGKTYSNLNKHKDAGENYNNAIEKLCKAYSFKSKELNPFIINSLLIFINKDDKDYLLFNFTDKLKDIDSFFIELICRYQEIIKNKNEEEQKNYKELLYSIYDLFESLRLNEKNDDKYIYHYTHKSIVNNQKLCLYSKESKENKTFFDFLKKKAEEKTELKDFIEKISQYKDTNIFTNSLTQSKYNINLENDNEIAIKAKKFNKTISGGLKIAHGKKLIFYFLYILLQHIP